MAGLEDLDEMAAGNEFRASLVPAADAHDRGGAPLWHGWAIMAAFQAGAAWARSRDKKESK